MAQSQKVRPLIGGLDVVSSAMSVKPGHVISGENYESEARGYRRVGGYERYDGHPKPSDASLDTREAVRAAISAVPGSGPVRGVCTFRGVVYAFRDNNAVTGCDMFKATASGWTSVAFGGALTFKQATAPFVVGSVVTGATSGATGTIKRVTLNSGAWDSTGAGNLVMSNVSGTFQANENITGGGGGAAKAAGNGFPVAIPPGGKFRFLRHNFYASESMERLYIAHGKGRALEWDGTVMAPIFTGTSQAVDAPTHVGVHSDHLFLAFPGGSLQFSGPGEPLTFGAVQGAGEIGFGETITGLASGINDSLVIGGEDAIGYVVGTSALDFQMRKVTTDSGMFADTMEVVGRPIFLDKLGVRDMAGAETYGNWRIGTMTQPIEPIIANKRQVGLTPVGAMRVRSRDQYRLFWNDGTGIVVYFGRQDPESMQVRLGFVPSCLFSGEALDGSEMLLAGGADGFVYEMDKGTSFDGDPIEAFIRLSYDSMDSPNTIKRYHRIRIEGRVSGNLATVNVAAEYNYGNVDQPASEGTSFVFTGVGGAFGEARWDEFIYSGQIEGQAIANVGGVGETISVVLSSNTATEQPHTLSTLTINYSMRRRIR